MRFICLAVAAAVLAGGLGGCGYHEEHPAAYYQSDDPPGYVNRYGTYRSYYDYQRHYNGIDGRGESS